VIECFLPDVKGGRAMASALAHRKLLVGISVAAGVAGVAAWRRRRGHKTLAEQV
jgi:hypothetical protein